MIRRASAVGSILLAFAHGADAADLGRTSPTGMFRATCEDQASLCYADGCGRDQIEAALRCRALCPHAVVMAVAPDACAIRADMIVRGE